MAEKKSEAVKEEPAAAPSKAKALIADLQAHVGQGFGVTLAQLQEIVDAL